jgi:5-methylcytosine-specific restriction endonuclease McrA
MQSKFKPGMSWDNYGQWHIDHIIPLDHFDIETEDHIVSNLNNLQPLWSKDNIKKSNK